MKANFVSIVSMSALRIILCFGLGCNTLIFAQEILNQRISVNIQNETLENALIIIEDKGNFRFTYSVSQLPLKKRVSIKEENQKIKNILGKILTPKDEYEYKEIRQHILITKVQARPVEEKPIPNVAPPVPQFFLIKGEVRHSNTGKIIKGVSVSAEQVETLTNAKGRYQLIIPKETEKIDLQIKHPSFESQLIEFSIQKDTNILVALKPIVIENIEVEPVDLVEVSAPIADSINRVEDLFLVKLFVKDEILEEDLSEDSIRSRPFQFSFLPLLGTNGLKTGRTFNNISLNLLAGYSAGLNGIEAAGLLNIERLDANGIQIAGLGNIVGGRSSGVQFAGLSNINRYSVNGFQIAGVNNFADSLKGGQFSGVNNILRGRLIGVQATGGLNFANGDITGAELAGIGNLTTKGVYGLQAAALFNAAKTIRGVQLSAFTNVAAKEMSGVQAGIVNVAGEVRGFQLGIVNIADTVVWGAPIGLINIVRNGYNRLEVSASEEFYGQLKLKMGIRHFHNIFAISFHPISNNYRWAFGYGFASEIGLAKWLAINPGLVVYHVNEGVFSAKVNELAQINFNFSIKIAKRTPTQLFFGPSLNIHISEKQNDGSPVSLLAPLSPSRNFDFSSHNQNPNHNTLIYGWIGGQIGIRI